MDIHFVLYRSRARRKLTQQIMIDILAQSLRNNPQDGLTGFLHTERDHFLQYLEGPSRPLM
jgi:hypothetical protein